MKTRLLIIVMLAALVSQHQIAFAQSTGFCWVNQETSSGQIFANDIVNDSGGGFLYVVGQFRGTVTFDDGGPNETTFNSGDDQHSFIAKYDYDGNLDWAIPAVAGTGNSSINSADFDFNDGLVVVGQYNGSVTFDDGGSNETTLSSAGGQDIFLARFDDDGDFDFAVRAGGPDGDRGLGVQFDFDGIIITGLFRELSTFETRGSPSVALQSNGASDIFLVKYNSNATDIDWARQIGSGGDDRGEGIAQGNDGQYITGEFFGSVNFGSTPLNSAGDVDMFLAKFDPSDGTFEWAKRGGGSADDRGSNLGIGSDVNGADLVLVTGWFKGIADFESQTLIDEGNGDFFLAAYDEDGNFRFARGAGGSGFDSGVVVAGEQLLDDTGPQFGTAQVAGEFQGSITFAKGQPNETILTSLGQNDIFIAKYNEFGQFLWAKQIGGSGNETVRGIFSLETGFFSDEFGESVPLQNTFIAGSFQSTVNFGTLPPTSATSQAQADVFVTRLSDFLRPINLQLEQIANTPYLRVTWDPPFNAIAPIITNPQVQNLNSNCAFGDGSSGTIFRIRVDYADVNDGDVNNQASLTVPNVFTPSGGQVNLLSNSTSIGGNGFGGSVTFDVCIQFELEDTVDVTFAITDAAGNVSNFMTLFVAKPVGGNDPGFRVRTHGATSYDLGSNDPAIMLNCGASRQLSGYNIFRTNLFTGVDEFLSFVPPQETIYVDELTEPSTPYLYRATARYAEGETEHLGNQDQSDSPPPDNFFNKRTDLEIAQNGGFSLAGVWGDFNNDGFLDMFVPNFANRNNFLFQNNGGDNFTRITVGSIVNDGGNSYSASWGDYNNDGFLDLFVANASGNGLGQSNFLYKNIGGAFEKIVDGAIVNDIEESNCGVWGDYNNDGFLDLYVANGFRHKNSLYRNNGDGTFAKTTSGEIVNDEESSFAALWWDYDDDHDLDLFVANDFQNGKNSFYRNDGPPDFNFQKLTSAQVGAWIDDPAFSRGASSADYDNDGDLDLFIANRSGKNVLLRNLGVASGFMFAKINQGVVANDDGASFGSGWGDFDNDGDVDLFVSNFDRDIFNTQINSNFLYLNDGVGNFSTIDPPQGNLLFDIGASHGSSWADYDRNGFLDMFVSNGTLRAGENLLYQNNRQQGSNNNSWISIKCIGSRSPESQLGVNRSAMGVRVRAKARIAGKDVWQTQEISGLSGGGWGGQNSLNVEFGLGNATKIDSLVIVWPLAEELQILTNVAIQQDTTIVEPQVVNQAPSLVNDQQATNEDTPVNIPVLTNDSDPDDDTLTITAVSQPQNGSTTIIENNTEIRYEPNDNFNGNDSFAYTVSDGHDHTANGTVQVQIAPVNDEPQLTPINSRSMSAGEIVSVRVSAFDVDDDQVLTFSITEGPEWIAIQRVSDNFSRTMRDGPYAFAAPLNDQTVGGRSSTIIPKRTVAQILATSDSIEIILSPPQNISGNFEMTLEVRDSENGTDSQSFAVQVDSAAAVSSLHHHTASVDFQILHNGVYSNFSFHGESALQFGGLIAATGPNRVAVNLNPSIQNFKSISGFAGFTSDADFDQISECQYDEKGANLAGNPLGIQIKQFALSHNDHGFVILSLEVTNTSAATLTNLHIGQVADWDIGQRAANRGGYDSKRNMVYQFEEGGQSDPNYYGISLLEGPTVMTASGARVDNSSVTNPASLFSFISDFGGTGGVPPPITTNADYSSFIGAGPLTLSAGATAKLGFAWLAGEDLGDLQRAADVATDIWKMKFLVGVEGPFPETALPKQFMLEPNFPNPFNPETQIAYHLPEAAIVKLAVYNTLGQKVKMLVNGSQPGGSYHIQWNGRDDAGEVLASGIYFLRIEARSNDDAFRQSRKMLLIK
jgi:hypothetical protein